MLPPFWVGRLTDGVQFPCLYWVSLLLDKEPCHLPDQVPLTPHSSLVSSL